MSNKIPDGCTIEVPPERLNSTETIYDRVELIEEEVPNTESRLTRRREDDIALRQLQFCNATTRFAVRLDIKNCKLRLDLLERSVAVYELKRGLDKAVIDTVVADLRQARFRVRLHSFLMLMVFVLLTVWYIMITFNQ
jgi:hypothetical protein